MVFSSVPVYLDPPSWQQQQPSQQLGATDESLHLPPLPPPPHVGGSETAGSIRPGSMADRARLAKIPQPETALKCPRCESTNTKFCYFNNYSLSQPRHFCKTCRRYWTRGGALRSVPVGGGCRRNKKTKSQSSSKSPVLSSERQMGSTSSTSTSAPPSQIIGHFPQQSQYPFVTSLHNLTQFGVGNIGLNFGGIQGQMGSTSGASGQTDMEFQIGNSSGMSSRAILSPGGVQQFPFFEPPPTGLYQFQSEGAETPTSITGDSSQFRSMTSSTRVSQFAPVKTEGNQGLNLSKPYLGIPENSQYHWGGNYTWTDLSGLNSSSTSHFL